MVIGLEPSQRGLERGCPRGAVARRGRGAYPRATRRPSSVPPRRSSRTWRRPISVSIGSGTSPVGDEASSGHTREPAASIRSRCALVKTPSPRRQPGAGRERRSASTRRLDAGEPDDDAHARRRSCAGDPVDRVLQMWAESGVGNDDDDDVAEPVTSARPAREAGSSELPRRPSDAIAGLLRETASSPLRIWLTVERETPASRATSVLVARRAGWSSTVMTPVCTYAVDT